MGLGEQGKGGRTLSGKNHRGKPHFRYEKKTGLVQPRCFRWPILNRK